MASYNTVPAEDTRLQEAPKTWKLKKIVVVSAALSFSLAGLGQKRVLRASTTTFPTMFKQGRVTTASPRSPRP